MLRRRLPTAELAERYARVVEIEVGQVLIRLAGGLRLTLGELGVGKTLRVPNDSGRCSGTPAMFVLGHLPSRFGSPQDVRGGR